MISFVVVVCAIFYFVVGDMGSLLIWVAVFGVLDYVTVILSALIDN